MHRKRLHKNDCCFADRVKNCLHRRRCSEGVTSLSDRAGSGRIKVCKITGDRKTCARMASMGVYPGVEADIICAEQGNRCLLKVHGGTISLDPDMSQNIFVTPL